MVSDSRTISLTTKNRKFSRRGFLEKALTGITLASAVSLATFASIGEVQAGSDESSSQRKPKVAKGKGGKKAGNAAKPAGGSAQPAGGGSAQPAGGFTRPETAGY